jgi:hypothetical protein
MIRSGRVARALQSFCSIASFHYLVIPVAQQRGQKLAVGLVIIDDENHRHARLLTSLAGL